MLILALTNMVWSIFLDEKLSKEQCIEKWY